MKTAPNDMVNSNPAVFNKDKLLKILDFFVGVCRAHGLRYYLAGGSALGAVRHKGFIPWDDDIDVYMPRDDYERIQTLPDSVWEPDFRLATWRKTKKYTYDIIKLELVDSTVLERFHPDYIGGVFLDVFPLDRLPNDPQFIQDNEKALKRLYSRYADCTIKNDCDCNSVFELIGLHLKRLFYNHRKCMEAWERIATKSGGEGDFVTNFHDYFSCHGAWPVGFLGTGVQMAFEGTPYVIPEKWDSYLRHVYGDYMQLPPLDKRCGHSFDYVNYDRRLSESELKAELDRIHRQKRYRFSVKKEIKHLLKILK